MQLNFLGASGTVTGSKYLVTAGPSRILIDCGLFQGRKDLRLRNWAPFPIDPRTIDCAVLTHAHIDHSGWLPRLVRDGFAGPIYSTEATRDLCRVLLLDCAHLMEEEAAYANRHGYSRHSPALPLFTREDAAATLERFRPVPFDRDLDLDHGVRVRLLTAGHILGAAMVRLDDGRRSILFSGDLGRPNDLIVRPPGPVERADYLVVESTYGDRRHEPVDPQAALAEVINRTARRGGIVAIPAFAVARAQGLLYRIHLLKQAGAIPSFLPVYLDSPMATDVTEIFCDHRAEHRLDPEACRGMCTAARRVASVEESKKIDAWPGPAILIAGSGMITGGRILHHLKVLAPEARNTILLAGYQASGTRGADLVAGAREIKIHGAQVRVRAEVAVLHGLSGHADASEILDWLRCFQEAPRRTFVTHGEPPAASALRERIEAELGWSCHVPCHLEAVSLE